MSARLRSGGRELRTRALMRAFACAAASFALVLARTLPSGRSAALAAPRPTETPGAVTVEHAHRLHAATECGAGDDAREALENPLEGEVRDARTGAPVAGCELVFDGGSGDSVRATTDASGAFEVILGRGEHGVELRASGLVASRRYRVRSPRDGGRCHLWMEEPSVLDGRVTDEAGVPIRGAELRLVPVRIACDGNDSNLPVPARSDGSGRFRFQGVPRAPYSLRAAARGRSPIELAVDLTASDPRPLLVALGPAASLEGRVSQAGAPVEGATVWLRSLTGERAFASETGRDGFFVAEGLGAGAFELGCELADEQGNAWSSSSRIDLAPGERRRVELESPPAGRAALRVQLDRTGGPDGATVVLRLTHARAPDSCTWTRTAEGSGLTVFDALPAGAFALRVELRRRGRRVELDASHFALAEGELRVERLSSWCGSASGFALAPELGADDHPVHFELETLRETGWVRVRGELDGELEPEPTGELAVDDLAAGVYRLRASTGAESRAFLSAPFGVGPGLDSRAVAFAWSREELEGIAAR